MQDTEHFSYIAYTISETLGTAQLFLDFKKRTYTSALKLQMENLGCTEVSVVTFGNDGGKLAGRALYSVQKLGERAQYVHGSFGACKPSVMNTAQEKRKEDEQQARVDRTEEAAKTAAAVKASMIDLNKKQDMLAEGQTSLQQGVTQIGEQMVRHEDVQGLRSDSVDAIRDLEKRFKETQQALQQSQRALKNSQRAEAETKKALQESGKHLTDEQNKNSRQGVMLARLNAQIKDTDSTVSALQKAKSKLETENAQLKTKLSNLQNLQTMQEDVRSLKKRMSMISEQLTDNFKAQDEKFKAQDDKFKTQDEKQDEILQQGADIMATAKRIETMHEVAFSGDSGGEASGEEDGVGCKRRRTDAF